MNEQECIIKLLESLEIGARRMSDNSLETYMLECNESAYIGGVNHFAGYANILMKLMSSQLLCINDKIYAIKNPYYGCKSLEEALVKKDLLGINFKWI